MYLEFPFCALYALLPTHPIKARTEKPNVIGTGCSPVHSALAGSCLFSFVANEDKANNELANKCGNLIRHNVSACVVVMETV